MNNLVGEFVMFPLHVSFSVSSYKAPSKRKNNLKIARGFISFEVFSLKLIKLIFKCDLEIFYVYESWGAKCIDKRKISKI